MKKLVCLLSVCLSFGMSSFAYAQGTGLKVDGMQWNTEATLENKNGTVMISAEDFSEIFAGDVRYTDEGCIVQYGERQMNFKENINISSIGEGDYATDYSEAEIGYTPYRNADGCFMIPLRSAVETLLEKEVKWNDEEKTVEVIFFSDDMSGAKLFEQINDRKIKNIRIYFDDTVCKTDGSEKLYYEDAEFATEEEIKSAVRVLSALGRYKAPLCRCISNDITCILSYENGEIEEMKFYGIKECGNVFDKVLNSENCSYREAF